MLNTLFRWPESLLYGARVARVEVPPPLFILGHPRSGTTHLHNLLSIDERFAHPNLFQVNYPHTFLCAEGWAAALVNLFLPKQRFMDNIRQDAAIPYEEEWALCVLTAQSPYVGWSFPHRIDHYEKYLTFRELPAAEATRWKAALLTFVKKVTYKYQRPLILKSPPHTCRVKLLLELFPGARFVHIHRNPYAVFQSTQHLWSMARPYCQLQSAANDNVQERILKQYRLMHDAWFEERALIPEGNLHELRYEDLEQDPIGEVRKIYQALSLPDMSVVEAPLKAYVASLADYQKNRHTELAPEIKQRVAREWSPAFEAWGYPV